jgi:hypothetical protein
MIFGSLPQLTSFEFNLVISTLVGIALDAEKLTSLDQPVADFAPEGKGTKKGAIT